MAKHIFVSSDLGCEVAATSLARYLAPADTIHCVNAPITSLADIDLFIRDVVPKIIPMGEFKSLTLFGDFWTKKWFTEWAGHYSSDVHIMMYTWDGAIHELKNDGWDTTNTFLSMSSFVVSALDRICGIELPPATKFAIKHHSPLLKILNDRSIGQNVEETQPFFTGLANLPGENSEEENIYLILTGEYRLENVIKIGLNILKSQRVMARNRAMKNARQGEFKDGTTYVVSEAPELVNLTHEALRKEHPSVDVTICASLKFTRDQDQVAHSMRSWNPTVDVKKLIGERGGGSSTAAGGRVNIDISLDY